MKRIGWLPLAFGIFVFVFVLAWTAAPAIWGIEILNKGEVFGWLFVAFGCTGLVGIFFALKMFAAGLAILRNRTRCTVIVSDSLVVNRERFGWFSHNYKFKRSDIEQLFVVERLACWS